MVALITDWSWSMEGNAHEDMALLSVVLAHYRIFYSMCIGLYSFRMGRRIIVQHFLPVSINEIAIGVRPKDFTTGEIERYLFESMA